MMSDMQNVFWDGFDDELAKLAAEAAPSPAPRAPAPPKAKAAPPGGVLTPGGSQGAYARAGGKPLQVDRIDQSKVTPRFMTGLVASQAVGGLHFDSPFNLDDGKAVSLQDIKDGWERGNDSYKQDIGRKLVPKQVPGALTYDEKGNPRQSSLMVTPVEQGSSNRQTVYVMRDGTRAVSQPRIQTVRASGVTAHERGHADNHIENDPSSVARGGSAASGVTEVEPGSNAATALEEAVASFRGMQHIKDKDLFPGMSAEKSWGAFAGLPTYVNDFDDKEMQSFWAAVHDMDLSEHPGLADAVRGALKDYKGKVLPALVNQPGREWGPEATETLRQWREQHGVEGEMSPDRLYDVLYNPAELGPFSSKGTKPSDAEKVAFSFDDELGKLVTGRVPRVIVEAANRTRS